MRLRPQCRWKPERKHSGAGILILLVCLVLGCFGDSKKDPGDVDPPPPTKPPPPADTADSELSKAFADFSKLVKELDPMVVKDDPVSASELKSNSALKKTLVQLSSSVNDLNTKLGTAVPPSRTGTDDGARWDPKQSVEEVDFKIKDCDRKCSEIQTCIAKLTDQLKNALDELETIANGLPAKRQQQFDAMLKKRLADDNRQYEVKKLWEKAEDETGQQIDLELCKKSCMEENAVELAKKLSEKRQELARQREECEKWEVWLKIRRAAGFTEAVSGPAAQE